MAILDFLPLAGTAIDAITGAASAKAQREAFKHRYQDTVADMRKAGLNPALAYGQGGGNPSTVPLPELGSTLVRGAQAAAGAKQALAQREQTVAQTNLLKAQTGDLINNIRLKNQLLGAQTENTQYGTALRAQQTAESAARTENIRVTYMQLWQDYNFQKASFDDRLAILRTELKRKGIEATTAQIEQDLKRLAIPEAKASARFYNSLGSTVPFMNNATQWLRILGGLVR